MGLPTPKQLTDRPWLDPNAQPQVTIEAVSKTFPGVTAVDDVTLRVFKGPGLIPEVLQLSDKAIRMLILHSDHWLQTIK